MPGQFINTGNTPGGKLSLVNTNNLGNALFYKVGATTTLTPWYIYDLYEPATGVAFITIPDHNIGQGLLNPNAVGTTPTIALYINPSNGFGTDYTTDLMGLVGNHTHLTLSWGTSDFVTYDCTSLAFEYNNSQGPLNFFYDADYGTAPFGSVNVIATSGTAYVTGPVTISYTLI
jgi:hypothetical protein